MYLCYYNNTNYNNTNKSDSAFWESGNVLPWPKAYFFRKFLFAGKSLYSFVLWERTNVNIVLQFPYMYCLE